MTRGDVLVETWRDSRGLGNPDIRGRAIRLTHIPTGINLQMSEDNITFERWVDMQNAAWETLTEWADKQ